jgi:16S rRNA U516 pseudouridylate synthase RsuA-like enzyme
MAAAGVASRRACEDLIASGVVTVNGQQVKEQGSTVLPGTATRASMASNVHMRYELLPRKKGKK